MAQIGWTARERLLLRELHDRGLNSVEMTVRFPGKTAPSIRSALRRMGLKGNGPHSRRSAPVGSASSTTAIVDTDGTREYRSNGRQIRTVEDLLRHAEIDMTIYEIASSEATKYEVTARGPDGIMRTHEMFRVFVKVKPKAGPSTKELVAAMIHGVNKYRQPRALKPAARSGPYLQVLVVADPHFGKYAWGKSTGEGDYDVSIARRLVRDATTSLLDRGDRERPEERLVVLLGDIFHFDTPSGATTGGTMLDHDSRLQKMISEGSEAIFGAIDRSAETCKTNVLVVPGNHDTALSWALQLILRQRYRNTPVGVNTEVTDRKYVEYGGNLLGFVHGDKTPKQLPQIMALQAKAAWGRSIYREVHRGHLHHQKASTIRPYLDTIDGVVVRTAPALCPPDAWHNDHGFIGSPRGMETFLYKRKGGLYASFFWQPEEGSK